MKKLLSILLVLVLCLSAFPISALAAGEDIVVSVKGGTVKQGGTIVVPISLDVNKGFATLGLKIHYDSNVLEIVCPNHVDGRNCSPSVEKTKFTGGGGDNGLKSQYHTVNPYVIQWAYTTVNNTITQNITQTGDLAKITFKVKSGVEIGTETTIRVEPDQATSCTGARRTRKGDSAVVRVVCVDHTYDNACDTTCNECGAARAASHNRVVTITPATTTADGKAVKQCTECGSISSQRVIKKIQSVTLSATSYSYSGKVRTPSVTVKDSAGKVVDPKFYTVLYAKGRINAGTYKVTVTFKGDYSGSKTVSFKINPISGAKAKINLSTSTYLYNGKARKPGVTVTTPGGAVIPASNYTVTYAKGRTDVGTYKVTVTFKGNYTGSKTVSFTIVPPKTTLSLVAGKKAITVNIAKKSAQVTGYQIQYATNKNFTKAAQKTIGSYKTTKYTLKSLAAKKTYYVRVRTYKTVSGKHYYSGWSTAKAVKTK